MEDLVCSSHSKRAIYQHLYCIGCGASGQVYAARRREDGLLVAIKYINNTSITHYALCDGRKLPMEICALKQCARIPGIIRLVDMKWTDTQLAIVMNRPEGYETLYDYLASRKMMTHLDEATCRRILHNILDSVIQAYGEGIVHRDLKLSNILLHPVTLQTILIDFGSAASTTDLAYNVPCTTILYAPPEFFSRDVYLHQEATVWSLGVITYQLLMGGILPFDSITEIQENQPYLMNLSRNAQDFLTRIFSLDPHNRPTLLEMKNHPWMMDQQQLEEVDEIDLINEL